MKRLNLALLFTAAAAAVEGALTFNTSAIRDFNLTKSSYHISTNNTEYLYWSLDNVAPMSNSETGNINIAVIGDGINGNAQTTYYNVNDSNITEHKTNNAITEDTLAAMIIRAVAPDVNIISYDIFSATNVPTVNNLVSAVEHAVNNDDVDIIFVNAEQAAEHGVGGWSNSALSEFFNAVAEHKPIIMGSGFGLGAMSVSDGASAAGVVTVGGAGWLGAIGFPFGVGNETLGAYMETPLSLWMNNSLVLGEFEDDHDRKCRVLKNNVSDSMMDVLLLNVTGCNADDVVQAVENSNFTQLLAYSNRVEELGLFNFDPSLDIVSGMISNDVASSLTNRALKGDKIFVKGKKKGSLVLMDSKEENFDAYSINFNTSMGPTLDLGMKPNVIAQSHWYFDELDVFASGTGLAAAYVAGGIASYLAAGGNSKRIVDRVTTCGELLDTRNMTATFGEVANPAVQGGGMFSVEELLDRDFSVYPGWIEIESDLDEKNVTITITNESSHGKRFHVMAANSITMYMQDSDASTNSESLYAFPVHGNSSINGEVMLEAGSVYVDGGSSMNISVVITAPEVVDKREQARLPLFGGYITVSDGSCVANVPYMGTTSKLSDVQTQSDTEFWWKIFTLEADGRTPCTFWEDGITLNGTNKYLQMYWNNRVGSPMVDIQVVPRNWTSIGKGGHFVPVADGSGNEGGFISNVMGNVKDNKTEDAGILGRFESHRLPGGYPWLKTPRSDVFAMEQWEEWHGFVMDDGSILADGDYRILLKVGERDGNGWYEYVSPWFKKAYGKK
jgi:hypothetical protein